MTDSSFQTRHAQSQAAVQKVAAWLGSEGNSVTIPPSACAPSMDVADHYKDNGDLYLNQRIEVKHKQVDFTDRFPFPDIIICKKEVWDHAVPKPYMFVYLNKPMTHAAIVMGNTSGQWIIRDVTDKKRGHTYSAYLAPIHCVRYREVK